MVYLLNVPIPFYNILERWNMILKKPCITPLDTRRVMLTSDGKEIRTRKQFGICNSSSNPIESIMTAGWTGEPLQYGEAHCPYQLRSASLRWRLNIEIEATTIKGLLWRGWHGGQVFDDTLESREWREIGNRFLVSNSVRGCLASAWRCFILFEVVELLNEPERYNQACEPATICY